MNRIFTQLQKRHLFVAGGGQCSRCGADLGEAWEAHHVKRFADGGVTELPNGMALCETCHRLMHRRVGVIEPRGWQVDALAKFYGHRSAAFLLEATPGSGKTIFSGLCARHLFDSDEIDFVVVVVPTTALKGDSDAGFLGDWHNVGIELTTVLKDGKGRPTDFRGGVITYQQLPNMVTTLQTWASNGSRLMFVFDEIHHASEDNRWGAAAENAGSCAKKIIAMTGTPFRGDGRRISFVKYGADDVAQADHRYSYRESVRDKVCRQVVFMTDDGVAQFLLNEADHEVRISEASEADAAHASGVIFKRDSDWLKQVVTKADAKLDEYRSYDLDAGGLVICRPGIDDNDDKHLQQIARLVRDVTGEQPEIITHDDPDANPKIERFRKGHTKWMCAVRKVSEGVDIKRLRVEVIATRPSTELLFRQIVGRVVRVDDPQRPGHATVFLAKFPQLTEWAERIADEAQAGLDDADKRRELESSERETNASGFIPLRATHEDGGAISDFGEAYSSDEVSIAEALKKGDPELIDVSVAKIAKILRKVGHKADPVSASGEPLHVEKKKLRTDINRFARQLAIRRNPDKPDFSGVWTALHRHIGARGVDDLMDNYSIDVMRQAEALLKRWLGATNAADAA